MTTRIAERRPLGALGRIGIVAAMHVGLLFVIARSLGIGTAPEPEPLVGTFYDEPRRIEDPPPAPPPEFPPQREVLHVPAPEVPPIAFDIDPPVIDGVIDDQIIPPTRITEGPVVIAVRTDSRYPLSQPPYPQQMIREGHEGYVDLEVYVLPSGRVGDARVIKSTGFDALDQSALEEAKRKWRLMPATRDGVPQAQWHRLRVVFKLNQQR